ncbi:MAG: hypothetical protein GVY13_17815 [Alphaproteobacteria bacterium]|jgi:hypothetical protein|nr:hypothetical protein [Alphaproteobacteria bacterium]
MTDPVNVPSRAEAASLGTALIETMLARAPRPGDGEIVTVLIALHDMVEAYWRAARPEDQQPADDLVTPLYSLLTRYRPVTLTGVEAMLAFLIREMRQDPMASTPLGFAEASLSGVRGLRRLEEERHGRDGIPMLCLASPHVPQTASA